MEFSPPELLPDNSVRVTHTASGAVGKGDSIGEAKAEALRLYAQAKAQRQAPRATGCVPLSVLGAADFIAVLAWPDSPVQQERFTNAAEAWLSKSARKRGKLTLEQARAGNWPTGTRNRDIERAILAGFRRVFRRRLPIVVELVFRQWRVSFDKPETMRPFFGGRGEALGATRLLGY